MTQHKTGAWARVRRAAAELTPEAIEQIAQRVAEILGGWDGRADQPSRSPQLVDAVRLARLLGVSRQWIYEHADELGAVQLGDGERPRLRFDPAVAAGALEGRRRGELAEPEPAERRVGGRSRRRPTTVPLLPVHEPGRSRRIAGRIRSVLSRREG